MVTQDKEILAILWQRRIKKAKWDPGNTECRRTNCILATQAKEDPAVTWQHRIRRAVQLIVTTGCTQYISSTLVFTAIVHSAVEERVVKHLKTDPQQAARHQVLTIVLTTISPSPPTHFRQGRETLSCLLLSVFPTSFPPGLFLPFPTSFLLVSVSSLFPLYLTPPPHCSQSGGRH